MIRVKICGLTRIEDVVGACAAGADAIGFVGEPSSSRFVTQERMGELAAYATPFVTTVGVFGSQSFAPPTLLVQAVQFAAGHDPARCVIARHLKPGLSVADVLAGTQEYSALHLDAYVAGMAGGTGRMVDLDFAAEVVKQSRRPVILAGGLNPANVATVIRYVKPSAVDLSTGVESGPGIKDYALMVDFILQVRGAFN